MTGFSTARGLIGGFTDDTQMTLFTAEGLILSRVRKEYQGSEGLIASVYHGLLRWLSTQETDLQASLIKHYGTCSIVDGILTGHGALFSSRSPDKACLSALLSRIIANDSLDRAIDEAIRILKKGSCFRSIIPVTLIRSVLLPVIF